MSAAEKFNHFDIDEEKWRLSWNRSVFPVDELTTRYDLACGGQDMDGIEAVVRDAQSCIGIMVRDEINDQYQEIVDECSWIYEV